jgi:myo-inositol catabolism protein IolS
VKYRKLGNTELEVSVVSMGCWGISGGDMWGKQDEGEAIAAIRRAYEKGINFYDTAEAYGDGYSEELLGEALDGFRKEVKIASKVSPGNLRPKDLKKSCENSLRRLNTDYLDLYYIHWPNPDVPIFDTVKALEELKNEGKIRYYGTSNFGARQMKEFLQHSDLTVNQLPYNLLWRIIEQEIQPFCLEKDIGIAAYSPLLHGLLTGKFGCPDSVPDGRARTRHFSNARPETRHGEEGVEGETFDTIEKIKSICQEFGTDMAQTSIAWALTQSGVDTVIAGARSPEHVDANAEAGDLELPEGLITRLEKATKGLKGGLGNNPDLWQGSKEGRIR